MSITKRQDQILKLLSEQEYITVEKLSQLTYTSASSIRRDLAGLQNMGLVKRTHGGASVVGEGNQAASFQTRLTRNIVGKKKIARKASSLLQDVGSVMLDGSSTAAFLVPYIARHKEIRLFTNNMMTAINAIGYGIDTFCIGGNSINGSPVLVGTRSYETVGQLHPDILFFSSHSIDRNGVITDPTEEENYLRSLMLANAKRRVFLCDSEKFNRRALYTLTSIDEIDVAVFDTAWDDLKTKCTVL